MWVCSAGDGALSCAVEAALGPTSTDTPQPLAALVDGLIDQLCELGWLQPCIAAPEYETLGAGSSSSSTSSAVQQTGGSTSEAVAAVATAAAEAAMSSLSLGSVPAVPAACGAAACCGEGPSQGHTQGEREEGGHQHDQDGHCSRRPPAAGCCAACGAPPAAAAGVLKRCSGCRSVRYCSAACQAQHWPLHKAECRRLVQGQQG